MIYITQLVYIKENEQKAFEEFEAVAIPIISKYRGKMMLRVRPDEKSMIEFSIEQPYEIHLVSFESESDFKEFMADDERKKYLHLKEQSIRSVLLFKGEKL